jgi:putative SOS response-associated peptidase YedK
MCGRYRSQQSDPEEWTSRYGSYGPAIADTLGQIEVRPTDSIAIVRETEGGERVAEAVRWGIQPPRAKRPLINARDDKLLSQGLWSTFARDARSRILIPADGWYEWLAAEDPKVKKQPFLHLVDGGVPFAFAGLLGYAIVKDQKVPAATIITTDSAGAAARIHDRMPVVLGSREAEEAWLSSGDAESVIDALCVSLEDGRVDVEPVTL